MSSALIDSHGRTINYVRLAVTDRCNLRCTYCMPEKMQFVGHNDIMTYEEMLRLVDILSDMGVNKVRLTGGEPYVRRDLDYFIAKLSENKKIKTVAMTTNAVLLDDHLDHLANCGVKNLNISLDTLDRERFKAITRRDKFDRVHKTLMQAIEMGFRIKLNMVVMDGVNTDEIVAMAELARDHAIGVRFIEQMPFDGDGTKREIEWNHVKIKKELESALGKLQAKEMAAGATGQNFLPAGFVGDVGIIAAWTRTFCGTCNRLRINAQGRVRTCLYGDDGLDLRALLRNGASDEQISEAIRATVAQKPIDGRAAERLRDDKISESMSTIGG